jgi:uncharacterized protein
MGKRSSYVPGTFCWVELGSSSPDGSRSFYSDLLGWQTEDAGFSGGDYTTCRVDGLAVAGVFGAVKGMPTAWMSYVAVGNVQTASATLESLGGHVIAGPAQANELGSMAVVQDPGGAVFALWEANELAGAELVNDPGAFCLTQLNTRDPAAAKQFYAELFGWTFSAQSTDPPYWGIDNLGRLNAGMTEAVGPDHWLVYFTTADLDAACERIIVGGGTVEVHPMEQSEGRLCVARDPEGAYFGLFEGHVDD